ncbi:hypothetical protein K490DRAFT_39930 [Saccharata proteae CBS 121410]|uniref:Peptidase A1 domain-containing protein n=1 Tax=Saccharata proteae CBS 121410 TaxID=1314787 RepID=A0A9P4HY98_9PEZI|nr:hypothetical protein K490DRAFT_39930 [Saccharata proteae CBS 121410]
MGFWRREPWPIAVVFLAASGESASNLKVPWSTEIYGPDGPWHAVTALVGGLNSQGTTQVDLFPGGIYGTFLLTDDACSLFPNTTCGKGGLWSPDFKSDTDTGFEATWRTNSFENTTLGSGETYVQAMTINGLTVGNVPLVATDNFKQTSPGGTEYGSECGTLALGTGSTTQVQVFDTAPTSNDSWGFEFPAALYNESIIPSYSWMLHIGSANLDYDGSLILGGYDKGRTIGPYLNYTGAGLSLLDIGLGVERGASPFSTGAKTVTGLLLDDTNEQTIVDIYVDELLPYMYLPAKTCERLAQILPLTYDTTLRYYLWNTEDSSYETIITSPTYLSFVFNSTADTSTNVTIKVPLMLLNLTLSSPLVEKDTQYFPCLDNTFDGAETHRLGRAFLQSAFYGYNYNAYTSWLGQAAGPGLGEERIDIADATYDIETNDDNGTILYDSWRDYWTPLAADSSVSATPSTADSGSAESKTDSGSDGLATGAIAGIIVGAICALLVLAGGALWWWRQRRQRKTVAKSGSAVEEVNIVELSSKCPFGCPHEKTHLRGCPYGRSHDFPAPIELYATQAFHELSGSTTFPPRELDGRQIHFPSR